MEVKHHAFLMFLWCRGEWVSFAF